MFADKEAQLVVEQATYESKKKTTVGMLIKDSCFCMKIVSNSCMILHAFYI